MKNQFLSYGDNPQPWGKQPKRRRKRNFYYKMSFNKERNIKENIITNQALKTEDFLEKMLIVLSEKTIVSVG